MFFKLENNEIIKILILSLFFILPKWILSYYFFDESIDTRVIFEIDGDGEFYLPLIKYFAELSLANSFDPEIKSLNNMPIPFGSLFLHSLFYLIIGNYNIIFLELFYFFLIFYFLCLIQKIYFNNSYIIPISLLILLIPSIILVLGLNDTEFIKILSKNLFGLRLHRPIATSFFLVCFIYLMMIICETELKKRNSFFLGLILGLTLSSFYYFFLIQALTILFLFLFKYKIGFFKFLKENFINIIYIFCGFLIFVIPFFINLSVHESDLTERMGVFALTAERRSIILEYYLEIVLSVKFLIFFSFNFIAFLVGLKLLKEKNFLIVPFMAFLSSILSPFIFFSFANKSGLIYHFNNNIIICSSIFLIFFVINFLHRYSNKLKFYKLNIFIFIIFFVIIFNNSINYKKKFVNNSEHKLQRYEFVELTRILSKYELSERSILTFDNNFMIWLIMKNVKSLKIINGLFVPKKNDNIEKNIILAFKFFQIPKEKFSDFIMNKNENWRYFNRNIANFFYARYQANKAVTYKNSKNFEVEEYKKIVNSSPSLNQQLVIPIDERKRLIDKFILTNKSYINEPDIIILNKNNFIYKNLNLPFINYCVIYDKKNYLALTNGTCE